MSDQQVQQIPTYCALCISRCGCIATVENGRLTRVDADPEHPTGRALCVKAKAAPEVVRHPERLSTPLLRTRPKGDADPGWRAIGWDEALDLVAQKLTALAAEHGPQSVAFAVTTPSGTAIADSFGWIHRLAHAFGSPNLVFATENCNWHKDFSPALTWGAGIGMPDYANTRLILLWGFNPTVTWLAQATAIREAQKCGAKLVVIDPRRQGLARHADLWLAPHPGSDGALALGLMHLLLADEGIDHAFLQHFSDAPFLVRTDNGERLSEADLVAGGRRDYRVVWDEAGNAPAVYDPSTRQFAAGSAIAPALGGRRTIVGHAGAIACRPVLDLLRERCAEYPPERTAELTGVGLTDLRQLALWLASEGPTSFFTWTGTAQQTNATQTTRAITTLYALTGCLDAPGGNVWFDRPPVRDIAGFEKVAPATRAQTLGIGERPLGPPQKGWITTRDLFRAIVSSEPYPVRALVSFGGNFALTKPDTRHAEAALSRLDFFVMTELFMTPSAQDADLILPVASCWEREGLQAGFMVDEAAEHWLQLRPAVVAPHGESRPDNEIIFALAQRLGLGAEFFDGDPEAGLRHQLEPTGLTPEALRASPRGVATSGQSTYRKYQSKGFATPSGRVELFSQRLQKIGDDPLPDYRPPQISPAARPDLAARYPLRLTCAKWTQFCHSQQRQIAALRRTMPEALVEIHPEAGAARGIADGDRIAIETPHGRFVARARLSSNQAVDVVCAQYGWWRTASGEPASYNAAIDGETFDPLSGSNGLRAYLCEARRLVPAVASVTLGQ